MPDADIGKPGPRPKGVGRVTVLLPKKSSRSRTASCCTHKIMGRGELMLQAHRMFKASLWPIWVSRLLGGAVGLVLVSAALLKASDMAFFVRQVGGYGIISDVAAVTLSAWGLIALECSLGVALLVSYRPRLILSLTAILLLIFTGATGWSWLTGATESCGCFGPWMKRTPGEAVLEDMILLVTTGLSWIAYGDFHVSRTRLKTWTVFAACIMGLAFPALFGFPLSAIYQTQAKAEEMDLGHFNIEGTGHIDLNHGAHLLVLMSTDCLHCKESVPALNALAEATDLPGVIALCTNEESQRIMFGEEFQPMFPIGKIAEDVFWRLLGDGDMPRVILVRNGHVQKVWDQKVPEKDRIKAILTQGRSTHLSTTSGLFGRFSYLKENFTPGYVNRD